MNILHHFGDILRTNICMCVRECCKLSANILSCHTLHTVDLQTDVIQVRQLMGHAEFGARVVYGDCIFFTISPNEQHSALVLRLSRYRKNDPYLQEATEHANTLRAMGQRDAPALETETGACFRFLVIWMRLSLSRRTPPSNAMAEMFVMQQKTNQGSPTQSKARLSHRSVWPN